MIYKGNIFAFYLFSFFQGALFVSPFLVASMPLGESQGETERSYAVCSANVAFVEREYFQFTLTGILSLGLPGTFDLLLSANSLLWIS